jgi:chemotaxis protein MotB
VQTEQALPENFDQLYEYLKAYVERNGMQGSVDIQKSHGSVYIRFKDNIFFDPDNFVLKKDGTAILDFLGDCLKNVEHKL